MKNSSGKKNLVKVTSNLESMDEKCKTYVMMINISRSHVDWIWDLREGWVIDFGYEESYASQTLF